MESHLKLFGHPVHPMLVMFPLALLSVAVVFDVIYLATGTADFARLAFWDLTVGLIVGLAAAITGLLDWIHVRPGSRARRIGAFHGVGNAVVVVLFAASWVLRLDNVEYAPSIVPLVLALAGAAIAVVTAWLGGELVYRLRIGVDDIANADAPSSLGETSPQRSATRARRAEKGRDRPARIG